MSRYAAKKDSNHNAIAAYLEKIGWSVMDLSFAGKGVPDMAVSRGGWTCMVECKSGTSPSSLKLTPGEARVRANWSGPYLVATSPDDAARQLLQLWRGWKQ